MNTSELPTPDNRRLVSSAWLGSVLFDFVATPAARNKITTRDMAQHLIDRMEANFPHDELPPHYDWLVAQRDSLPVTASAPEEAVVRVFGGPAESWDGNHFTTWGGKLRARVEEVRR